MEIFITLLVVLGIAFLCSMVGTAIVWAIWNYVICAVWVALPALGFWQVFLIMLFINIVFGGLFRSNNNSKND